MLLYMYINVILNKKYLFTLPNSVPLVPTSTGSMKLVAISAFVDLTGCLPIILMSFLEQ